MTGAAGIVSTALSLPSGQRSAAEAFADEGQELTAAAAARLGIREVRRAQGETGSALALAAAQDALRRAEVAGNTLDVIVDYSFMPQEFLVPAWSMSNKLQAQLGASKAFTVGFSGGGTTNFLTALHFAAALIESDSTVNTALLLGADLAIDKNRVLNRERPLTILGDAATAVVVRRGAAQATVLASAFWTDGALHDVCYIPGGAMSHPDRLDLYRMQIDAARYERAPRREMLARLIDAVLGRAGATRERVKHLVCPNFSAEDRALYAGLLPAAPEPAGAENLQRYGHTHGHDLVLNYGTLVEQGRIQGGDLVLLASHGLGFSYGVTLLKH